MDLLYWISWAYIGLVLFFLLMIFKLAGEELLGQRMIALLYHRLIEDERADEDSEKVYVNTVSDFRKQMQLIKEKFHPISMDDYMAAREGKLSLPKKAVVVTFDDGFASNYRLGLPILKEFQIPATIFVATHPKSKNFEAYAPLDRPMTAEEIQDMSRQGVSIQSHSHNHLHLTRLSEQEILEELTLSRKILEELTGKEVVDLAAPFGVSNQKVEKILKQTGYRSAFSGKRGSNTLRTNPYDLRRVVVERFFSLKDFEKALSKGGIIRDKILGFVRKDIVFFLLGEERTENLRHWVYHSPLAFFLHPRIFFPTLLILGSVGILLFGMALKKLGLV